MEGGNVTRNGAPHPLIQSPGTVVVLGISPGLMTVPSATRGSLSLGGGMSLSSTINFPVEPKKEGVWAGRAGAQGRSPKPQSQRNSLGWSSSLFILSTGSWARWAVRRERGVGPAEGLGLPAFQLRAVLEDTWGKKRKSYLVLVHPASSLFWNSVPLCFGQCSIIFLFPLTFAYFYWSFHILTILSPEPWRGGLPFLLSRLQCSLEMKLLNVLYIFSIRSLFISVCRTIKTFDFWGEKRRCKRALCWKL